MTHYRMNICAASRRRACNISSDDRDDGYESIGWPTGGVVPYHKWSLAKVMRQPVKDNWIKLAYFPLTSFVLAICNLYVSRSGRICCPVGRDAVSSGGSSRRFERYFIFRETQLKKSVIQHSLQKRRGTQRHCGTFQVLFLISAALRNSNIVGTSSRKLNCSVFWDVTQRRLV
jgi:hypothetical protein